MRIRCPACSATYEVADALLTPPRTVRCAKCAHDWMAEPIVEIAEPAAAAEAPVEAAEVPVHEPPIPEPVAAESTGRRVTTPEPEPEPVFGDTPLSAIERLSAPVDLSPHIRRRDRTLTFAWAASFAIIAALGVAGYTQRDRLMQEWPASKRVYAKLGLIPPDMKNEDAKGGTDRPVR